MLKVAESLFEITLPRFSGDALPKTEVGIVLAIADRFRQSQLIFFLLLYVVLLMICWKVYFLHVKLELYGLVTALFVLGGQSWHCPKRFSMNFAHLSVALSKNWLNSTANLGWHKFKMVAFAWCFAHSRCHGIFLAAWYGSSICQLAKVQSI